MSNIKIIYDEQKYKNMAKYGDDKLFESWLDINLFFPIGDKLVDPLYCMGLTPNNVTLLSTFFTILAIYFLHIDNRIYAFLSYLFGYVLDCVDGRMARKYSMGSKFGMVFDCTSDNISNGILITYLLLTRPLNITTNITLIILFITSFLLSLSYGLNEAIIAKKSTGNDNFYKLKLKELEKELENKDICNSFEIILYKLFLFITKISYQTYKLIFPNYDQDKIFKWLKILKHFGPGNFCLLVSTILLYI
jgi:phosphatidylglycerophosphate synthase